MNTAIIADIHGNLPGLHLVLRDIAARGIEKVIGCGTTTSLAELGAVHLHWMGST